MKDLQEILSNINNSIDRYNNLPLIDYKELSEILRELTSNLFYLEGIRSDAKRDWNEIYLNSKETSVKGKEREADMEVHELYMIRRVMTAGYRITDAIRSQISIYKKEG